MNKGLKVKRNPYQTINGILKTEFKLNRVFQSRRQAMLEVTKSIDSYNHLRPHMSCNYLTPAVVHTTEEPLIKKWKNCRKKYNKTKEKQLTL